MENSKETMYYEQLRKNVRRLRIEKKLTQAGLAEKTGYSRGTIVRFENGKEMASNCTFKFIVALAIALDVDIGELYKKEGNIDVDRLPKI